MEWQSMNKVEEELKQARRILESILYADERGQGVGYSEAMKAAKKFVESYYSCKQCYDDAAICKSLSKTCARPCETCNDDPEVCASVPSLRHCEKATRGEE